MLQLNLQPIFKLRGIEKPYTFLVKSGFTAHSANDIATGKMHVLKLAQIELLCKVLICEPNDLFVWTPDSNTVYNANHPLFNLLQKEATGSLKKALATLPLNELISVTNTITNKEKS